MPMDYVEVNWDKPRKLMFDWEQLEALGTACGGLGFNEITKRMEEMDLRVVRKVIWHGIRHYDTRVKESEIPGIIVAARKNRVFLNNIVEDLGAAIRISEVFGENKQTDDGQPPADPSKAPSATG